MRAAFLVFVATAMLATAPAGAIGYFGSTYGTIDGTGINPCSTTDQIDVSIS